jgi:hypothetical protein
MGRVDVRRLAAIDMYGARGSRRRAQVIRIEFVTGALAITAFGCWLATRASGPAGWLLAIWILGIGINYVPLAAWAHALRAPAELRVELSGVDTARELRRYGVRQLWILVPFSFVAFAVAGR